ncbi:Trypanosome variant surface glycoprotein (A-type), putative [Trypanosoma equiperdum]|uniref:Trypanosome variant surface glycoprotein (A-type), putative n=1 Tax=Trypanosoma equiperdum TaxID=5694 RepID=A0A1G4HYV5_TRYEQ|nr:Trypanosome variant surface glycoprotein (A-type), putative [Trypanosoma equiperdum]
MTVTNNDICIAGGPIFTTEAQQLDSGEAGDYGRKQIQDYKETDTDHYFKQAAVEIKEALGAVTAQQDAFDPNDLGKFTDDNDFIAAVGAIYGNLPRDKATGEAKNTVPNLITEHFGKQENFKTKIWEEIEKLKAPATVLGEKKQMTLKEVNDIGLATRIMAQHITDSFQKLTSQAEKRQNQPKQQTNAKSIKQKKLAKMKKVVILMRKNPMVKNAFQTLKQKQARKLKKIMGKKALTAKMSLRKVALETANGKIMLAMIALLLSIRNLL